MQRTIKIKISLIEDAKKLAQAASHVECDIDLVKGSYKVDAKSIMGIMSIDNSTPVDIIIHDDTSVGAESFIDMLNKMSV